MHSFGWRPEPETTDGVMASRDFPDLGLGVRRPHATCGELAQLSPCSLRDAKSSMRSRSPASYIYISVKSFLILIPGNLRFPLDHIHCTAQHGSIDVGNTGRGVAPCRWLSVDSVNSQLCHTRRCVHPTTCIIFVRGYSSLTVL